MAICEIHLGGPFRPPPVQVRVKMVWNSSSEKFFIWCRIITFEQKILKAVGIAIQILFFEDFLVMGGHVFSDLWRISDDFWRVFWVLLIRYNPFQNVSIAFFSRFQPYKILSDFAIIK